MKFKERQNSSMVMRVRWVWTSSTVQENLLCGGDVQKSVLSSRTVISQRWLQSTGAVASVAEYRGFGLFKLVSVCIRPCISRNQ